MSEIALTKERIREAAEDILRRFGPSKATVVDVARALSVSHASVYKHFTSKAELRYDATRIWLARDVVQEHVEHLTAQVTHILQDDVARGEFTTDDPVDHDARRDERDNPLLQPLLQPLPYRRMARRIH